MNEKVLKIINEIEEIFPVSLWKMNGIDVWPWLRVRLYFEFSPTIFQSANSKESEIEAEPLGELFNSLESKDNIDVIVLIDSFIRIKLMDGRWYHRLASPFHGEIQKNNLKVANMEYSLHNVNKTPVSDESYSIKNQLSYFLNNMDLKEPTELNMFDEVKNYIENKLGVKIACFNIGDINYEMSKIERLSKFYEYLIIKKKTRLVLIVNYYNPVAYPLIVAARRLGIPTVDIQHGTQSPLVYHKWCNIPSEGYNILPDYFWCWSETEAKLINKGIKNSTVHQAIAGGNPWLELWKEGKSDLVRNYDRKLDEIFDEKKVKILLTLQPKYGLIGWDANIPNWVYEAIVNSPNEWKWYVRYHPSMEGKYSNEMEQCENLLTDLIIDGKVETIIATQEPLMALLRKMDVHVTAFSTSVIEAKYVGVPSVTLHENAKLLKEEIKLKWILEARTRNQLIECIKQQNKRKNENNLPEFISDSIGLTKGIETLLNKSNERNSGFPHIDRLIEKECYFADKEYNKVIENLTLYNHSREKFILGKAYEALGEILEANVLFEDYLLYLMNSLDEVDVSIQELLYLKQFFEEVSNERNKIVVENWIGSLIRKFEWKRIYFFRILFLRNDYKELQYWINTVEHNLDILFYVGRILIDNNEIVKGIEIMDRFIKTFDANKGLYMYRTYTISYKISVFYYMGMGFFKLNRFQEAYQKFLQCDDLSNGGHEGAREFLLKIKNMNIPLC